MTDDLGAGQIYVPADSPMRPLWDAIRKLPCPMVKYPNVELQGEPRPEVGDIHPSQPWQPIGAKVDGSPDVSVNHIVPKVELLYLPRFLELSPEHMWEVIHGALNLQWLPTRVSRFNKGARHADDMVGVDEAWKQQQIALQHRKRSELTEIINALADSAVH